MTETAAANLRHRPPGARPRHAMILAAGLGTRMRPLTDVKPKPLVPVHGRTLIDHTLDRLADFGVQDVVINLHYRSEMVEAHLAGRSEPPVRFTHEETLLDTGGGIANALPMLGDGPFFVANGDALWLNGPTCALERMAALWDDAAMDGLLLLHSTVEAYGYEGLGDFVADPAGLLARRPEKEVAPYLFAGVQLLHPRLFTGAPSGAFSMNLPWDRAIGAGRLYGVVHDGEWFHIGTPGALQEAETYLNTSYPDSRRR